MDRRGNLVAGGGIGHGGRDHGVGGLSKVHENIDLPSRRRKSQLELGHVCKS